MELGEKYFQLRRLVDELIKLYGINRDAIFRDTISLDDTDTYKSRDDLIDEVIFAAQVDREISKFLNLEMGYQEFNKLRDSMAREIRGRL